MQAQQDYYCPVKWCRYHTTTFIRIAELVGFFKDITVLEERKERHYEAISLVTLDLIGYIGILPICMLLQPTLKNEVNHSMMIEEDGIIWGGTDIAHNTRHIGGRYVFEVTNSYNNVNLQDNNYDYDNL